MQCVAEQDGDYYVLNGSKNFITHGASGQAAVVIARTGALLDSRGMTAFIIEKGTPGFQPGKKENKLGMRASETAELHFENCKIHKPGPRQSRGRVYTGHANPRWRANLHCSTSFGNR